MVGAAEALAKFLPYAQDDVFGAAQSFFLGFLRFRIEHRRGKGAHGYRFFRVERERIFKRWNKAFDVFFFQQIKRLHHMGDKKAVKIYHHRK